MGHASTKVMISALEAGSWAKCLVTAKDIIEVMREYKCPVCILGKRNQTRIHKSVTDPTSVAIASLVSGDIIGPITPTAKKRWLEVFFPIR